jgi:hypothetical protein
LRPVLPRPSASFRASSSSRRSDLEAETSSVPVPRAA